MTKVAISGGFDPLHIGHIRLIREAGKLGDELIIILNTDTFLLNKKGYIVMAQQERKEILENIKGVSRVVISIDKDQTVANSIRHYMPNIFANGGDRNPNNNPIPDNEISACKEVGCEIVYGVGGGKIQSSSGLVKR